MKLAKRILLGAMAAVALVGCKDDPIVPGSDDSGMLGVEGPGVYFALQIDLPNAGGSRSVTDSATVNGSASSGGVEIGKDYENGVSEAIVVLADARNNAFIAAAPVNSGDLSATSQNKSSYVAKSKFSKAELSSYYELIKEYKDSAENLKANIFVYCNPTQNLRVTLLGETSKQGQVLIPGPVQGDTVKWIQAIGSIGVPDSTGTTSTIWAKNSFLMSNALIATRELPASIVQWNSFTSEDHPFHLSEANDIPGTNGIDNGRANNRGAIKVERCCARFDFRDGSKLGGFMYNVLYIEKDGLTTSDVLVQVELQKMFLVNQSNSFYYLPRVVAPVEGTGGSSIVRDSALLTPLMLKGICKPERPWAFDGNGGYRTPYGNYVADYNIRWKNDVFNLWKDAGYQEDKDDEDTSGGGGSQSIQSAFDQYFNYPFFNNDGTIDNTDAVGNRWSMYLCKNVTTNGEKDNRDHWTGAQGADTLATKGDYHIWCYSTENTIPTIEGQINGISTGVVFKAKYSSPFTNYADTASSNFNDRNTAAVAYAINNGAEVKATDPVIYMFSKVLYCGWENVREAALQAADADFEFVKTGEHPDTLANGTIILVPDGIWKLRSINRTNSLYRAVFGKGGVGEFKFTYTDSLDNKKYTATIKDVLDIDPTCANQAWLAWDSIGRPDNNVLEDGIQLTDPKEIAAKNAYKRAVTSAGFTIYQRSHDHNFGNGYYCYYYYWNRHNDNGFNGIMGPMEFAVVRNNVYKLAVTKINNLGHPRISENDPHRPGPGTPDEDESVYLDVTTEIIPWVVRVNNIEF